MNAKENSGIRDSLDEARRRLLADGASSYLEAIVALAEFRREVLVRSRKVLESRLPELLRAMGVPEKHREIKIKEYSTPDEADRKDGWLGEWAWITVYLEFQGLETYLGLCWQSERNGSPTIWASAIIHPWNREPFRTILAKFKESCGDAVRELWQEDIRLAEQVRPTDLPTFELALERVMGQFIEVWRSTGGVRTLGLDPKRPSR